MKNLYLSSLLIVSLLSCTQNQNQAMKQCSFVYYIQGHEERAVAVPKKVQEYINCMVSEEGALIPDEFVGGLDTMTSGRYIVGNDSYSWVGNWGVLLSDVSKGDVMWPAFYLDTKDEKSAPLVSNYYDLPKLPKTQLIKKLDAEYKRYFEYVNERLKDWKPQ